MKSKLKDLYEKYLKKDPEEFDEKDKSNLENIKKYFEIEKEYLKEYDSKKNNYDRNLNYDLMVNDIEKNKFLKASQNLLKSENVANTGYKDYYLDKGKGKIANSDKDIKTKYGLSVNSLQKEYKEKLDKNYTAYSKEKDSIESEYKKLQEKTYSENYKNIKDTLKEMYKTYKNNNKYDIESYRKLESYADSHRDKLSEEDWEDILSLLESYRP